MGMLKHFKILLHQLIIIVDQIVTLKSYLFNVTTLECPKYTSPFLQPLENHFVEKTKQNTINTVLSGSLPCRACFST